MTNEPPPRPDPLPFDPEPVPDTLADRCQWVAWRYRFDTDRDEWTKVPVDPNTGEFAKSTDQDTWTSFSDAVAYHDRTRTNTDGVGFVVHDGEDVVGFDLDDCRDQDTGSLEQWAEDVLDTVPTYAEVSPSGTGLRLFGLGDVPDGGTRNDVDGAEGHLEMYETGRYLTVTGHALDKTPADVRRVGDYITTVHADYIIDDEPGVEEPKPPDDGGVQSDSPDVNHRVDIRDMGPSNAASELSDDELLNKAKNAENGEKFTLLWSGDISDYPSHSEADLALCGLLAFWSGGDRQRINRLFRRSDLYREKWDRDDYRKRTIDKTLSGRSEFYDPDDHSNENASRPNEPGEVIDRDRSEINGMNVTLTPAEVAAWAGLGEDEDVSDLTDREKAACVWDLLEHTDEFHVRVRRDNGSLWAYDDGVWKPEGERALRHAARRALGSMNYGQNVLTELKAQARSDPRVEVGANEFGLAPGTIAVENGLVYLDAAADGVGEDALRELKPDDYALTRVPVEYNPSADYDEWADYVNEWSEDGRADALQEYVGYCLHVGAMPLHRALLLVGSGANGKGTFLHVVRSLLGRENTSSIELQTLANEKDAVADFYGALANIDDDLSARKLGQGIGMFKKLVGGDRVRARRLYEDGFEFDATGKHLYAANEVPDVNVPDDDEAFWRRWLLVEFPNHYPPSQRDPDLRECFTDPDVLSGVLNWAIDGWSRLLDQSHFTGEEQYAQAKRERWQAWGDSVDKFISKCVERDSDAENVSTGDVHRVYAAWCRENGERPASQQKLTAELKNEDLDYAKRVRPGGTGTPARGYKSLGFTEDAPDVDNTPERRSGQQQLG
ncbi:phage/plasmid primase, P4 family [Salinibaculum rarum]|uniref:phage/plasmid primase, P4 family n=1 Tax=Salinibaculum rarum TaxID=3058903 RepID=UPI00265E4236|nr:phage/plasmid primase, P4 family [Salinibaculum sp. KK48]